MTNLSPEAQAELATLMVNMSQDKDMRPLVNKFIKTKTGKSMPDVEVAEIRSEMEEEFKRRDNQVKADRARERLESQRSSLLSRYTDEQVKEIEALMEKKGIADYDDAAIIYGATMTPANPTSEIQSRTWELPIPDKKDLGNNNLAAFARKNAFAAIDEIKRNKKRA